MRSVQIWIVAADAAQRRTKSGEKIVKRLLRKNSRLHIYPIERTRLSTRFIPAAIPDFAGRFEARN
jgi:hypothetical protein